MKHISTRRLVFLCVITYFISYITRTNYGAIVDEMVAENGGWPITLCLWLFVSVAGTLLCLLGIPMWKRS